MLLDILIFFNLWYLLFLSRILLISDKLRKEIEINLTALISVNSQ